MFLKNFKGMGLLGYENVCGSSPEKSRFNSVKTRGLSFLFYLTFETPYNNILRVIKVRKFYELFLFISNIQLY